MVNINYKYFYITILIHRIVILLFNSKRVFILVLYCIFLTIKVFFYFPKISLRLLVEKLYSKFRFSELLYFYIINIIYYSTSYYYNTKKSLIYYVLTVYIVVIIFLQIFLLKFTMGKTSLNFLCKEILIFSKYIFFQYYYYNTLLYIIQKYSIVLILYI